MSDEFRKPKVNLGRVQEQELIRELSDLLKRAIATQGEFSADEWKRMEEAQRRAYVYKHPEVLD